MIELITEFLEIRDLIKRFEFLEIHKDNKAFIDKAHEIIALQFDVIPCVIEDTILPTRNNDDDFGLDIYAIEDYDLEPGTGYRFGTGLSINGGGFLKDKSSSAWYKDEGRFVIVCGGVIDKGYRGEIKVVLFNLGKKVFQIRRGKAFVQLIAKGMPVQVSKLSESTRGNKGFGGFSN